MLPVVAGDRSTRVQILVYAVVLAPVGVLPALMGFASPVYGVLAAVLGLVLLGSAVEVFRAAGKGGAAERRLFGISLVYLFLIFALLLVDHAAARFIW
jgi:protoheme IX farnesyltransferase